MSRRKQDSPFKTKRVSARTYNQKRYIHSILNNDITFCLGPAGSGKTHVAAGMASGMLQDAEIDKIVICRPVVSAGKDIGYLPGSMEEKVSPYLMPLFDEFGCYIEPKFINKMIHDRTIEIVPLSMMRGRTFNNAFVILDEAQNASYQELTTLLTRIGQDGLMVLAGDPQQSDLMPDARGAFRDIALRLQCLQRVGIVYLDGKDIVRHSLIADILQLI